MSVTKVPMRGVNTAVDTAAGDDANIGWTAGEGLILTGQGSTNDITIKNDADADVIKIATGGTTTTFTGDVTMTGTTPTLTIGDAGAEDTAIVFDGNAQDFHIGLDDTADDLVIGLGSALGTTTHMAFTEDGEVTKPLNPCVYVHKSSDQSNIAVDSDVAITWETEVFDIGANFASNAFTAPVTGKYLVNYGLRLDDVDSASTYYYAGLLFSNRALYPLWAPTSFSGDVGYWQMSGSIVADMDASDTFSMVIRQASGTQQTDIDGGGGSGTYLSIALIS